MWSARALDDRAKRLTNINTEKHGSAAKVMDEDAAVSPMSLNLDSQTAPGLRRHQVRTADRPAANLFPKRKTGRTQSKGS
jgi:hypothetical protein